MKYLEIRKKFLSFFEQHNHTIVSSSSLIPAEDPTLLFTNAGMNQFKDLFLGKETRSYKRATSMQKCVRAGGKHNDLDQVGFTKRHLTFFEMMGNFSFGDYFKKEAITFAWDFLTNNMKIDPAKLYATVYLEDDQAYEIWLNDIKIPAERIVKLGKSENFWQMGDTGPCGPCSEIYVDRGVELGCGSDTCQPSCDCPRYVEIWNLVFMQFNQKQDGSLEELAQTGVDTGMGFERLCMVIQGKDSVFEIDMFQSLIESIEHIAGKKYESSTPELKAAFHVLADHIRSSALLIADGCSPSNDGRGYVLRKIIRRAALFAQKLSDDQKLFSTLAKIFIESMADIFPELKTNAKLITSVLDSEIERFSQNLVSGQNILVKYFEKLKKAGKNCIPGEQVFKLYDTYGFPPELTQLFSQEHGFTIDMQGFEQEMQKQKAQSGKKMKEPGKQDIVVENLHTKFVGYETLENESTVQFVSTQDKFIWLSTQESPFYVESGGQVNDNGWVTINNQTFAIQDLKKSGETFKPAILVKIKQTDDQGNPAPEISVGDKVTSRVDENIRPHTVKNHTATHMLQAALIDVLGPQVKQAGSVVNHKYLRFDYTHHQAMTPEEIKQVEDLVNAKVQEDIKTNIEFTTLKDAKQRGIISFFGEKYNPEQVRVVEIPGFSAELCGGTHAPSTGIIGAFKITSETALATGTRRIVAITGPEAIQLMQDNFATVKKLSEQFKAKPHEVLQAVTKQTEQLNKSLTQIKQIKKQLYKTQIPTWAEQIESINGIPFLYLHLEGAGNEDMKQICTELSHKKPGFFMITSMTSGNNGRFMFMAHVNKDYEKNIDFKAFAKFLREELNMKGGGGGNTIQGGGQNLPTNLKEKIVGWLQ